MNFRCLSGFTLVELAVVLAVIAVVATFATPSVVVWHKRDQIDTRARVMMATLTLARSEAIRRGARVTMCRIDAAHACLAASKPCNGGLTDWSCGWALFADRGGARVLLRMQPAASGIAIVGTGSELSFTPPSGQVIGGFRSFDFSARDNALASLGARAPLYPARGRRAAPVDARRVRSGDMTRSSRSVGRDDSLIEVLIAMSLTAITALGIIGAQMWLARNERSLMARELATSIADSVAEGIRRDADRDPVITHWRARAAALLPDGDVDVLDRGDGLHIAVVKWRAQASSDGEAVCAEPGVGAKLACVVVAFAR